MAVDALNHDNYDISVVGPGFVERGLSSRVGPALRTAVGPGQRPLGAHWAKYCFKDFNI